MRTIAFLVTCVVLLLGAAGIGAQESDVAASDFDGSGKVDFQDFVVFARGFGSASADPGFDARLDLDGSGKVDFQDFVIFAGNFGKSVGETSRTFVYISDLDILGTGGKVDVFDLETNLLHLSITVPWPRGMAYSPSRKRLYVAAIET
ncbi:MAG: EF-hand domain-containing protein, partial [Candidatus Latescibacteria bacterium]|nr:EF-hand domain-containing protein [Candidatus Latescibacterota bacterium]